MPKLKYPDSPWYRTGDIRIVPGFMGFMQAQELWRKDSYNQYHGICTGFTTKWKKIGRLPKEVDDNFYAAIEAYDGESPFHRKWRMFINYLPGMGVKDPVPQSLAENARYYRNIKRELEREQENRDEYPEDD
jgi:hypothetical protein